MKAIRAILLIAAAFICASAFAQEEYDPVARAEAQVVSGNARFTVLTPRLIRMEWAYNTDRNHHFCAHSHLQGKRGVLGR